MATISEEGLRTKKNSWPYVLEVFETFFRIILYSDHSKVFELLHLTKKKFGKSIVFHPKMIFSPHRHTLWIIFDIYKNCDGWPKGLQENQNLISFYLSFKNAAVFTCVVHYTYVSLTKRKLKITLKKKFYHNTSKTHSPNKIWGSLLSN